MPAPLIGITCSRDNNSFGYPVLDIPEVYIQALLTAGANPVIIPLGLPQDRLQAVFSRLDGVLFSGGGDVDPDAYGGGDRSLATYIDPDRDRVELQLLQHTLADQKPFLGICRGLQLINVGLGGTLYEDLLAQRPDTQRHQFSGMQPRQEPAHWVEVTPGSRMAHVLGATSTGVNSFHHQGVRQLAPGLLASAFGPDGVIEAFELPGYPFGLAVQWHPEWMVGDPGMAGLFRAFVQAVETGSGG